MVSPLNWEQKKGTKTQHPTEQQHTALHPWQGTHRQVQQPHSSVQGAATPTARSRELHGVSLKICVGVPRQDRPWQLRAGTGSSRSADALTPAQMLYLVAGIWGREQAAMHNRQNSNLWV